MALVALAYLLGGQAAGFAEEWELTSNREKYRAQATEQTTAVLRKMGTIKVGARLSDFVFEDIDGQLHLLSKIVTDKTLIAYIKPDCDACLVELERLRSVADSPEDYARVILISTANPLHLQRLRDDYGLGCLILYDEERLFGTALKIQSFPFNMVVNKELELLEIHANPLLKSDYERLFSMSGPQGSRPTIFSIVGQEPRAPAVFGRSGSRDGSEANREQPDNDRAWRTFSSATGGHVGAQGRTPTTGFESRNVTNPSPGGDTRRGSLSQELTKTA